MSINVTKTYLPPKEKYIKYIDEIYKNGWLTNNGPLVKKLEKRLEEYLGVENLILVGNGTLGLQIAYRTLELKGDVLTTPFSFVATTSSLVWQGLKPIFVDIDKETLCMDADKIEKNITPNTSAILPVHVFGNSCDVEKIVNIASNHNLKVIFDAAHAFGVDFNNNSILNFGDASVLSFHSTKLFHTIEGGAIVFKEKKHYEKAKLLINFGIEGPDTISSLGINCKMNEFEAAMGLCVLDDLEYINLKRKSIYEYYKELFKDVKKVKFQKQNENSLPNYSYFPIIFNDEDTLLSIKNTLESNGIRPRRYFYPSLDTLKYIKNNSDTKVSNDISKRILCLPIYEKLTLEQVESIVNIILKVLKIQ